ncbi:tetratricopeptide repeat protein [Sphingopyxis sp.]|uniref:tetratricopeptide repeat protein n=1 Tax=Sphingopyxis sp. TaxID=1908224 RepID=UPI0026245335|nr:tetratricopeptide repeat protein [Sphingopyxis sp.]MCW0198177.1 sel1 repeat family protein [Sphingopyxis sp.]
MNSAFHYAGALLAGVCAVAAVSMAEPAIAQSASAPRDALGIAANQWLRLSSPELRARAGLPGSAPQILAAAEQGDPYAMALISSAYATGTGVPETPSEALRWAQRAAATGLPYGIHVLALDYLYGTGVPVDHARYLGLLRQAADAGSILAASGYATENFVGKLTPRNWAVAKQYAKIGAEGGIKESKMIYGTLLFDRSIPGTDPVAAAKWVRAAASDGYALAQPAARALQIQDEFSQSAAKLFVSSFGNSLVGGHTLSARAEDPCVTRLVVDKDGTTGVFLINWQETSVATAGDSFLNLTGAILNGTDRIGGDIRNSFGLSLHRDQLDVPGERDRMFGLSVAARALSSVCHSLG